MRGSATLSGIVSKNAFASQDPILLLRECRNFSFRFVANDTDLGTRLNISYITHTASLRDRHAEPHNFVRYRNIL